MQQLHLHLLQPIAPCSASLLSRSCMERRGQVVQLESGLFGLDSRNDKDEQQLSSQAEMGLFPFHWREGKRQKCCHSQLERIQSPTLSIQQSGRYALVGPAHHNHGTEEKENNHSENGSTRQQQQQAEMLHNALGNDKLLEMLRTSSLVVQQDMTESHEHLFYKVVTPSDVGKLNRLVIPKQHAERYFPLDPSLRKKGRLLSFQDVVSRELWWFRYSYWSSSQSYVLTKGWIRFVKDKDLQAGDIISFERGARHELYINCRKRPTSSRGFIDEVEVDDAAAPPVATNLSKLQLRYPDLGTMQLAPSSSEEEYGEEEEEATAQGTRLFGVDLRAKPLIQNITRL